ncbi:MAG: hypothetical protein AAB263_11595 [Planctomycetota bacterium]
MRILLDENVPVRLAGILPGHAIATVRDMRWLGVKNGRLIALAEASFDCLLTMDQGIQHQQNPCSTRIGFHVPRSRSNRLPDLLPFVSATLIGLEQIKPGTVVHIPSDQPPIA